MINFGYLTDREVKEKLMTDAMYKLEHNAEDEGKAKKVAPSLTKLEEWRDNWDDDFAINQRLRKKFREEKTDIELKQVHLQWLEGYARAKQNTRNLILGLYVK